MRPDDSAGAAGGAGGAGVVGNLPKVDVVEVPLAQQSYRHACKGGGFVTVVRLRKSVRNSITQMAGFDGSVGSKLKWAELAVRAAVIKVEGLVDPFTGKPLETDKNGAPPKVAIDGALSLAGPELIDCLDHKGEDASALMLFATSGSLPEALRGNSSPSPDGSTGSV